MKVTVNLRTTKKETVPQARITKIKPIKRGFSIKLSKKSCSGYQIQYSRKKSFKKAKSVTWKGKTAGKIRKLRSRKTYYVRARSFKIVGGKKYYGKYTKARKVRTK